MEEFRSDRIEREGESRRRRNSEEWREN